MAYLVGDYTPEENSVYIGKIAKYRRGLSKGLDEYTSAMRCAEDIIESDECKPGGALENRHINTQDHIKSFTQHLIHMDEVVAGEIDEENLRRSDKPWKGIMPRDL